MKEIFKKKIMAVIGLIMLGSVSVCSAEIVEGMAPIVNGNVEKARFEARQEALRTFVEEKIGVYVQSNTVSNMGTIISDRISVDSKGYVQIKNIISETNYGDVYVIKMDVDANDTNIELKYKGDVQKAMSLADEISDSRRVADVAVINVGLDGRNVRDEEATSAMKYYMGNMNVVTTTNNAVEDYMIRMPNPTLAELRRIAIENRTEANSILAGRIKDLSVNKVRGGYVAEVQAYYIFAGLNNNYTNSYSEYFQGAGKTYSEALIRARQKAGMASAEELTKSALKVMQLEHRGGVTRLNTNIELYGIYDRVNQSNIIKDVLQNMNCRIVRAGFTPAGVYNLRIVANGYGTAGEFAMAFIERLQARGLPFVEADVRGNGSPVIAFSM